MTILLCDWQLTQFFLAHSLFGMGTIMIPCGHGDTEAERGKGIPQDHAAGKERLKLGLLEARGPAPSRQCPPLMFPPGFFLFLTLPRLQMYSNFFMTVLKEEAGIDRD